MNVSVSSRALSGRLALPSSKSAAHRAIISAAIAPGQSRIDNVTMCDDVLATLGAVKALGCRIKIDGDRVTLDGISEPEQTALINCRESGSTLRFMIPVAAAYGTSARFTGSGRLPERPLDDVIGALSGAGIRFNRPGSGYLPLEMSGKLGSGVIPVAGNVSSQYLTGMLFACAISGGKVKLTTELASSPYVDMTCRMLEKFGARVDISDGTYSVCGKLAGRSLAVESDWSAAAFFFEAAALGGNITLTGLDENSLQADRACVEIYKEMGLRVRFDGEGCHLSREGELKGVEMDASQCPDLVPAVAVTSAFASGRSVIFNAGRLRLKESDRLTAVAEGLSALGVKVELYEDRMLIYGSKAHCGTVSSFNDHRIAMAFACAAPALDGELIITGAQSVSKSYPRFFEDLNLLGGNTRVIDNR